MKKDQGSMMRIFPAVFTIAAVSVILVFYTGWMANLTKKDEIKQIARSYILAMETEGCLTGERESNLRSDLEEKGLENIDLSGTTTADVGYGQEIFLCIQGDLRVNSFTTEDFFELKRDGAVIPIQIRLMSTAKH